MSHENGGWMNADQRAAVAQRDNAPVIDPCLEHFVDLAFQGRRAGSSGGEKRCRKIALCILENAPGLDGSAIAGLKRFIDSALRAPETARKVIG